MADYTTKAQIVLTVNGKQAQKILQDLEKQAEVLRKKMDAAAKIGDKDTVKKLQRELNKVEKQIDQIKGASKSVEDVLNRLDKASPKELKKTLSQLQRELSGIERGSSAWNTQMNKIQMVKAELGKVNQQMMDTKSSAERINDAFNKWQTAIIAAVAALTGIIMAARKAVSEFAEMDEQLANTRKFTGMTEEEVEILNDAFKKMDTRTARDQLNMLAQEAGRLGKSTHEDVIGYVKAADIINVALSDLGDGATQKIAKLSNIFKIEDQYGTYDSMVKIGSVINVLSQNCTASKPYLVEFANRLAGVGNMAKVSLQNIIGMGAVLDANAQKVEASATAIGQVLTRMYREPAKYAKVAGLEVKSFTDLLKKDANEAFLQFLSALKNAGGMDVLAPMFKDMGENGSRAITALATMAQHIDEVRSQQLEANKAFDEGLSVLNEYEIFNNTAQASIDKAKKRVSELTIELGQKLYPVMKYVHSSNSMIMSALNSTVDFIIKYHKELGLATAAIIAYNVAINLSAIATKANAAALVVYNGAASVMSRILPSLRLMFVALQNAVNYFTNGLRVSYDMQNRWSKAMSGMSKANWVGLILTVAAAVASLTMRFRESKREAEEAARQNEEYKRSLTDISKESARYVGDELKRLDDLYEAATSTSNSQHERIKAVTKLMELYPKYFTVIDEETVKNDESKASYDRLRQSILKTAEARAANDKIQSLSSEIIEDQLWISQNESEISKADKEVSVAKSKKDQASRKARQGQQYSQGGTATSFVMSASPDQYAAVKAEEEYNKAIEKTNDILGERDRRLKNIKDKQQAINTLYKKYSGSILITNGDDGAQDSEEDFSSSGPREGDSDLVSSYKNARYKEESEWREKEEALNRIAYAKGEKDFVEYTKRINEITIEFHEKQLKHTDLSELERAKITADYEEARKKQSEYFYSLTVDEENMRYKSAIAELEQLYVDDKISRESYFEGKEESEITHQYLMTKITKEGSEERAQAEEAYLTLRVSQMDKKQKEFEQLQKKYASVKSEYFSLSEEEKSKQYDIEIDLISYVYDEEMKKYKDNKEEMLRLEIEFQKAVLEIKRKYNQISETEYRKALINFGDTTANTESESLKMISKSASVLSSSMSTVLSQLNSFVSAEMDLQTAKIEKRYDREIQLAEGNSYKVKMLEKQKESEIAKIKNEANKKMFAMQVIQAVAQTATNAINAYGSAAAIPTVGFVIAPIAAAAAVAAGSLQIATIKKQQQASESQGYAEGGYTKKGKKYEPAGIVHAGEWVASQEMVNSPVYAPIIEALDYAQSNRVYPYLPSDAVSMSITAPAVLSSFVSSQRQEKYRQSAENVHRAESNQDDYVTVLVDCIEKLTKKLDEPITAISTIAGDYGSATAEKKYQRLLKNKG